jgi:ADP-L-glycero-D-manno-heptose 6-epimerase
VQLVRPLNPYALSKAVLDEAVLNLVYSKGPMARVSITALRFSNVYGPNEQHKGKAASMVSRLLWQIKQDNPTLFKDGSQRRDWVYYKDVIQAVHRAIFSNKYGIYNIGYGESVSFNDVVKMWNSYLKTNKEIIYVDNPFEGKYQGITEVDISKAKKDLGYNPRYSLAEGMQDYLMS